jgi:uncharacterized secreted protein with C-terminal beta-propeller domain
MKKDKMIRAVGGIDDKYIEEAAEATGKRRSSRRAWIKPVTVAACICLMMTSLGLWLFLPIDKNPPDVSAHSGTTYYELIQTLNALTYRKPQHDNNMEIFLDGFNNVAGDLMYGATMDENAAPESGAANGSTGNAMNGDEYHEVTDNQVAGVIEADIIKRSSSHIFYLNGNTLMAYSVEGEQSKKVGTFSIESSSDKYFYNGQVEMYLSADCKTLTIILPYSTKQDGAVIELISLDVSNPASITRKDTVSVKGSYLSSRMVNGEILLISNFRVSNKPDWNDESTFLPQIDVGEGYKSIPVGDIICPDDPTSAKYTVVCRFDGNSLDLSGQSAYLSYSDEVYVSANSVYLTYLYTDENKDEGNGIVTTRSMTEISRLSYAGGDFEHKGSVTVEGYIKDQYSLDELDGILRVVTTTNERQYVTKDVNEKEVGMLVPNSRGTSASIYCIELRDMTVRAKVERFAPKGEIVQSVRFDGTAAYVCTAVQLTDPVFFFDLSDLDNITYKDTGTIDGFSSSLINLGEGYLLGVGIGDSRSTVKVEIYEEGKNGVESVCKYEFEYAEYSTDYKSYFIDRESNLFGMAINNYYRGSYDQGQRYVLLHFDGYELHKVINAEIGGWLGSHRAVYIDGYFYMLGGEDLIVRNLDAQGQATPAK